ncbi:DUF4817 domain-containing protein [Trichonephila clavipes]|nr:DUF4817 domain-containing protein [Trichonephila clavipes]
MLSAPDKALLVKLFYMNKESVTIVLRKFRVQKNVKSGKGPLTPADLLKLVKRFEEIGKLEDRARAGRPCLKEARAPCIAVEMEAIASEAASGTSSAREAARRLGLPPSSVRNILRRILQLYPCKWQSCHELLPVDTAQREAFAKWAFSKMEQDPTWVFNILWTDRAYFSLHGDIKNHNCRIRVTSNPRPFFFETQCPVNGWIPETVNAQCYLTLLRETVVPCLIQRGEISNVTFMQDGATSHTANPVKGCGRLVVKVSDHGRHVMSSSPVPPKIRFVGQRCTLNLSRTETSSHWCGVVVKLGEGDARSGVVHVL